MTTRSVVEKMRQRKWLLAGGALILVALLLVFFLLHGKAVPIRIGVLHSSTLAPSVYGDPMVNAFQLAIEEANAAGGIHGQKIEALLVDCKSDDAYCAQQAERLITQEKVSVLFGCRTSSCRKAVRPVVEKYQHLLFFPMRYEGMEQSPNIIYTGTVPNLQIIPAVRWAVENLGKRAYLVGTDSVFPHVAGIIIKDQLAMQGGAFAGERYMPRNAPMDEVVADIARQRPEVVFNTLSGDSNAYFFSALEKAGLNHVPLVSFALAESAIKSWGGSQLDRHYVAASYFQSLTGEENRRFVAAFKARFGADATAGSTVEASYTSVHLWVQAAREAGSAEPERVQRTILRQTFNSPGGIVAVDADSRHLWQIPRLGKLRPDGQFDIVWDAGQAQEPLPFPSYRQREEWLQLLKSPPRARP